MSAAGNTNPGNFANRPTEEVKAIASMGGKASHGSHGNTHNVDEKRNVDATLEGRNPDGTFTKGSEAAKQAGHIGGGSFAPGLHSHDNNDKKEEKGTGRTEDGKFLPGGEAAKEAGHKGGLAAAGNGAHSLSR